MIVALAGFLLAAAPVSAHAVLVDADPAPNSVIPASPDHLRLFFSEAVDPASVTIRVLASDESRVEGLGPPVVEPNGQVVSASLPALDPGTYTVEYTVVSAVDGHPDASFYAFVVDPTGEQVPPSVPLPGAEETPPDAAAIAARWVATLATLALIGTVLVWLVHTRHIGLERRLAPPWPFLAVLAAVALAGLTAYLIRSADLVQSATGEPLAGATLPFDPSGPFGWTPYGAAMRIALLATVTALAGAGVGWLTSRADRAGLDEGILVAIGAAGVATAFGLGLTGHAAALGGPLWALVDVFHQLAIAAWLGALPAIGLLAWRGGSTRVERIDLGRRALRAHGPVALVAAPVVVLTGLANSPLVIGDPREIVATSYGNLLLAKALLVSLALGLGATNFFLARRGRSPRFALIVSTEVAVAVVAVAVGATLVGSEPAANRSASAVDPHLGVAHLYGESAGASVHGIVDLPEPGVQSYSFAISDPQTGSGLSDIRQVAITFIPPSGSGMAPELAAAEPSTQPWLWVVRGAYTPLVGTWEIEVQIAHGQRADDRVVLPLSVREVFRSTPIPPPGDGSQLLGVLAAPTEALPAGPLAWLLPIGLLAGAAGWMAVERQRRRTSHRVIRGTRVAAVVLAVAVGVSLTARDVVAVANRTPDAWLAAANPLAGDSDAAAAGELLYRANCVSCHGSDGSGDGPAAATLGAPVGDLAQIVPHRLDGELAWTIGAGIAGTPMPSFATTLLEGERWQVVTYLRARWPSVPE